MKNWTWAYLAATSAVFGYWQNNVAAGIFMLLFLLLLTRLLHVISGVNTRIETLLHQRLEDPTGGCTGYKDWRVANPLACDSRARLAPLHNLRVSGL
jgi:hypothetical protein